MIAPHPEIRGQYRLETELLVGQPIEQVFGFFSDAFQLETITPPWLNFRVLTERPIEIQSGTLIDYKLRLHYIPIRWRTEISAWEPPHRFVDRQLRGPYLLWHHEHAFEERGNETLVRDVVDYKPRGGRLIHDLFVKPDLLRIFDYRTQKLREIFNSTAPTQAAD